MRQDGRTDKPLASPLAALLSRMRAGDREAAAEFITTYESRIRRRIRGKLNKPMRRLFDSEEIFSTVSRRLDLYVSQGKLEAAAEAELWSLVFRMADNALIDKARVFRRLESVEGTDSDFARVILHRLREAESRREGGADIELEKALRILADPLEHRILLMWLDGAQLKHIAAELDESPECIRKKWERIRTYLKRQFARGLLT